jgi:hypothetical protein
VRGVPITVLLGSTTSRTAIDEECQGFLQLYEEVWLRHRPDVVVSFGGGSLTLDVLRRAKARGAATVFALHNLRYSDRATFADADAIIVASHFAAEHYRSLLGLECTVLPNLGIADAGRNHALGRGCCGALGLAGTLRGGQPRGAGRVPKVVP